ncbi:DNA-methyltransferase [Candidatus Viridilinea mediisalina]|uniref:Methyltransferase n=1 Tax=Candidatus Viridilinea mediisalina TaxID=2024553 RepID=A0A2A6RPC6_9CHLR|nr:site-specific DNA-methyltransferase [Candidatus Viridilinea mediisalina]PDW04785.1 site-specific DNA-methyltransferase [Candidatus Viridilinea mediisalina]
METQVLKQTIRQYITSNELSPLFILGDTLHALREIPSETIDCCMTSPPYWGQRQYDQAGIGLEASYSEYIDKLIAVTDQIQRVLKPSGSFWLNIGDTYYNKVLLGIPWRIALILIDQKRWVLRNNVIWNKIKGGPDNTKDRLRNVHEHLFHFVKQSHGYYYDADAIRSKPRQAKVVNGTIVSATGVKGVRYKRQIELSTSLTEQEKVAAFHALDLMLGRVAEGKIADFRMIIRGQQRTTHSNSEKVSGRAKELLDKGFYFLTYHPHGSKPSDVWDILPEDTQKRQEHFAAYPEDLCKIPILATCPPEGIVLDPFCGTGTTMLVARNFDRKSIGIDICSRYIAYAEQRCRRLL